MKKFYRSLDEIPKQKEKFFKPSMTVPSQALSIREIMQRYTRGIPLESKTPIYHDEENDQFENGRDIRTMDLSEIADEMQEIKNRLDEKEKNYKKRKAEESAKKEQDAREKWLSEMSDEEKQRRFGKQYQNSQTPSTEIPK